MQEMIHDAQILFQEALRSVQAISLLANSDLKKWAGRPLENFESICVVGAGKAAMAMAAELETSLPDNLTKGHVVVPRGYQKLLSPLQRITVSEASHPVPDVTSVRAADAALSIATACGADDLVLALISGGGSALWAAPVEGVALRDIQHINQALLLSGATIHQVNIVRKHLSRIKGGKLARAGWPATMLTLVISDVTNDNLSVIASGPTVADTSSRSEAIAVLQSFDLWESASDSVRMALLHGLETPGEDDTCFERSTTILLGSNHEALRAACNKARQLGYKATICGENISGEARDVGRMLAGEALNSPRGTRQCLLWGGETTVTVTGSGQGGRNQEVVLGALLALEDTERRVVVLSAGTDGIDGASPAAGAWATNHTAQLARKQGLSPEKSLANNDTYEFFQQIGSSLVTGPTHTNVMDIILFLVD